MPVTLDQYKDMIRKCGADPDPVDDGWLNNQNLSGTSPVQVAQLIQSNQAPLKTVVTPSPAPPWQCQQCRSMAWEYTVLAPVPQESWVKHALIGALLGTFLSCGGCASSMALAPATTESKKSANPGLTAGLSIVSLLSFAAFFAGPLIGIIYSVVKISRMPKPQPKQSIRCKNCGWTEL